MATRKQKGTQSNLNSPQEIDPILLSAINNNKHINYFLLDHHYCYTVFNKTHQDEMKTLWGKKVELGINILYVINDSKKREKAKKNYDRALQGNSFTQIETENISVGKTCYESLYSPVFDNSGKTVIGISVFRIKISTPRAINRKLSECEELFQNLLQTAIDAIVTVNPSGHILFFNKAAEDIFGYSAEEAIGQNVTLLMPEKYRAKHLAGLSRYIKMGKTSVIGKTHELYGKRKNGQVFPIEMSLSTFRKHNKSPVIGIIRDISDRRKVEKELSLHRNQLERLVAQRTDENTKLARLYKNVIQSAPVGIVTVDIHGRVTDANKAFIDIMGSPGLDETLKLGMNGPSVRRAGIDKVFQQILTTGRPQEMHQLQYTSNWGKNLIVNLKCVPQKDSSGKIIGIILVIEDVTKSTQDERKRQQVEKALQQSYNFTQSLLRISRGFEQAITYEALLEIVYWEIKHELAYQSACFYLLDDSREHFILISVIGCKERKIFKEVSTLKIRGDKMLEEIASAKDIVIVEDARTDPRTNKEIVNKLGSRTIINVPILLSDNILGTLGTGTFDDQGIHVPSKPQKQYLMSIAHTLALAIDRIRAQNDRERLIANLQAEVKAHKVTEIDLKKSEKSYKELYELFRTISDNMTDMLWAKDMDKRYIFANRALCDNLLNARDTNEPIGKTDMFFASREHKRHPDNPEWHTFGEICQDSDQIIIDTKKPGKFDEYGNVKGTFLHLDVRKSPLLDSLGKMIGVVGSARDVTMEKIMQKQLQESEEKYRSLIENSNEAIYIVQDNSLKFANPMTSKISGYTNDELLTIPFIDMTFPDDRVKVVDIYQKILRGEVPPNQLEFRILCKDGSIKWVSIRSVYIKWMGRPATLNFSTNITDRKRAEEQLIKLSRSVEQSPVSIIITDKDGNIEYVNPKFESVTGYSHKDVIGQNPRILNSGIHSKRFFTELWDTILLGKEWRGEICNRKKDGSLYWEMATLSPIVNESGDITNIVAIKEDITEQKETADALRESERKFRSLVEGSNDGIYVLQGNQFKFINPQFTGITGYDLDEINRNNLSFRKIITEEGNKALQEQGNKPQKRYTFEAPCKDSNNRNIEISVSIVQWEGAPAILGIMRDVTERIKTQRALEQALKAAKQGEKVKSRFLANMSHEIRTPLNSILGFTNLIEESTRDLITKEEKGFFEAVKQSGHRLMRTVHEILDISQIEAGTYQLLIEEFDLCECIQKVIMECKYMAAEKSLPLIFKSTQKTAIVRYDEQGIHQSIRNIVENAIKYTLKGSVNIHLIKKAGQYILSINDTGIGIAKEYLDNLFDAFSQESEGYTKKFQGIGLGMAITKRHLDLNNIGVQVNSTKGVGTTFTLTFKPAGIPSLKTGPNRPNRAEAPAVSTPTSPEKPTILLVEDDLRSQKLIEYFIKKFYNVCFAVSVNEAKQQMKKHHVKLILLDLSLIGNEDGLDLVRWMRNTKTWKSIPVIAATAHAFSTDREKCITAGCNDYLSKPILKNKLLEKISKLI